MSRLAHVRISFLPGLGAKALLPAPRRRVSIFTSDVKVRWTGHRFGDLEEAAALWLVQRALKLDLALDSVNPAVLRSTIQAISCVDPTVA